MKTSAIISTNLFISVFSLSLFACGGGDGGNNVPNKPIVIPIGSIAVTTNLGVIKNADVTVYDYSKNTHSNEDIISQYLQATDINGKYTIDIQSQSTPILVCINKGAYEEEASELSNKVEVTIDSDNNLCAITNYKTGSKINLNINFFTHLAFGLTENKIQLKAKTEDAIISANKIISEWLGSDINILTTIPKQITNSNSIPSDNSNPLSAEHKYGFANAAISQLMKWIANKNKIPVFTNVTSIIFAQRAFEDIRADGLLNGKAGPDQLLIVEPISEDLYRHKLALNLLIMASVPENNSTLGIDSVFTYAESINNYSALFLSTTPSRILSKGTPIIDVTNPAINDIIFGNALINPITNQQFDLLSTAYIKAVATDIAGIQSVEITLKNADGSTQSTLIPKDTNKIRSAFDSNLIPDGSYTVNISATNVLGISTNYPPINISIGNTVISTKITSPLPDSVNAGNSIFIKGIVNEPSTTPLKSIELNLDGNPLQLTQPVDLASSTNAVNAVINSKTLGLTDGAHTLSLIATSTIQNRPISTKTVVFNIDNTIPTIINKSIVANKIFSQAGSIPINYTIIDPVGPAGNGYTSGIQSADFLISGLPIGSRIINPVSNLILQFNPLSTTAGVRNYIDGWHELLLSVSDNAGNQSKQSTIIGIDSKNPTIAFSAISAQDNAWINNLIVDGTSTDNPGTGVEKVEIFIDKNPNSISTTLTPVNNLNIPIIDRSLSLPFKYQAIPGSTFDGKHLIKIRSTDYAGKFSEKLLNIGLDTLPPLVSITSNPTTATAIKSGIGFNSTTIVNCKLTISSNDPGYNSVSNNSTGSGLWKEDIFVADSSGVYPTTPTLTKQFSTPSTSNLILTTVPVFFGTIIETNPNGVIISGPTPPGNYRREVTVVTSDISASHTGTLSNGVNTTRTIMCLDITIIKLNSNPNPARCTHSLLTRSTIASVTTNNLIITIPCK